MRRTSRTRFGAALSILCASVCMAVPLTPQELTNACTGADGLAHCGRIIEDIQMKRYPNLAARDGDALNVTLFPAGRTSFMDTADASGGRSYSLWDYMDTANIAVIYATKGDDATFLLLQRTNGRVFEIPSEPKLSPDHQRIVTADFCATQCRNEVALWRITPDGVRKEASWTPAPTWSDASVRWKSADTIELEYSPEEGSTPRTVERRIDQADWKRVAGR
jgi:hypothetical protein